MKRERKTCLALTFTLMAATMVAIACVLVVAEQPSLAQNAPAAQNAESTTYVAVEFADGTRSGRAITWTTAPTRAHALIMAGFEVEYDAALGTICSIDGEGCPATDCFCADNWWANAVWNAGAWDTTFPPPPVQDDDVLGFRNGPPPAAWGPPQWPAPRYRAIADALEWLRPRQSPDDGSYASPFGKMGPTTDMALAVSANSSGAEDWRRDAASPSLADYVLGPDAAEFVGRDASTAGKMGVTLAAMSGAAGAGQVCWPGMASHIADYYEPSTGTFYDGTVDQAGIQSWTILGMAALSETIPAEAVDSLVDMANQDGGWAWSSAWGGSDAMATAQSIQALLAAGVDTDTLAIQNGLDYLKDSQNDDGGFFYTISGDSDVSATAYAVQAIIAAGEDPVKGTWQTYSGTVATNPISYLLAVQLPDGSFPAYSPMLATVQALPALLERPYPLAISPLPGCPTWSIFLPLVAR